MEESVRKYILPYGPSSTFGQLSDRFGVTLSELVKEVKQGSDSQILVRDLRITLAKMQELIQKALNEKGD